MSSGALAMGMRWTVSRRTGRGLVQARNGYNSGPPVAASAGPLQASSRTTHGCARHRQSFSSCNCGRQPTK